MPQAVQGQVLPSAPTFTLLLGHDSVAEREQTEELMHMGVSQIDGFQQAGVPELEPWVRQWVEGEIDWLWPLAGAEMGLRPCGTRHSQAPALQYPYLSQLCLVTQHILHVTCEPRHRVNQDRDPMLLPHWHPHAGRPQGSGRPTTLWLSPFVPQLPPVPQRVCRRGAITSAPCRHSAWPWCPALTIAVPVHRALAEDHYVLGEGAGLVREDVFHLPQLLIEGGGPGLGWRPALGTVHLLVPVDEVAVPETDHLHTAGGESWVSPEQGSTLCRASDGHTPTHPRPPSTWGTLAPRALMLLASSRTLPQGWPAPTPTDSHRQARAGDAGPGTKGVAHRAPQASLTPTRPKPPPRRPGQTAMS